MACSISRETGQDESQKEDRDDKAEGMADTYSYSVCVPYA